MSILPFRRRPARPAPRHSSGSHREITPAEAAAHADAFHGRAAGTRPYPEPAVMTAASAPWAGAQDPAMEISHEAAAETMLLSTVQSRAYVAPRCLLPAIPLDAEIRLWVRARVASGAYEDIDMLADRAERRVQRGCDRAHWHARQTLTAGWRQIGALVTAARWAA